MATPAVAGFAATLLAHDANMSATHVADSITCLSTKGALTDIPFGTLNQLLFAGAAIADEDCINGGPRPPPAPPQAPKPNPNPNSNPDLNPDPDPNPNPNPTQRRRGDTSSPPPEGSASASAPHTPLRQPSALRAGSAARRGNHPRLSSREHALAQRERSLAQMGDVAEARQIQR